jgi:transcriptional/translational regulatory protein YebC/TACO1
MPKDNIERAIKKATGSEAKLTRSATRAMVPAASLSSSRR